MKKRKTDVSLGRRHAWVDTQGHAHKVVFDETATIRPRATWIALGFVTVFALLLGGALVVTTRPAHEDFHVAGTRLTAPGFAFAREIERRSEFPATAIASGWNDEFFLADRSGVALFSSDGDRLDFWRLSETDDPTSLSFVADEKSGANGLLLVGYRDRILSMQFSLERYVDSRNDEEFYASEERGEVYVGARTAQGGALSEFELALSVPGGNIRGLACSAERLFVADYAAQRVRRWTLRKIMTERGEDRALPFESEFGAPDEIQGYPGLKPAFESAFCIAFRPETNAVFVANSGLFRLDAFDAGTGAWRSDLSWGRTPDSVHGFSGAANPISFAPSPEWIATAEVGRFPSDAEPDRRSALQIFDLKGDWFAETGDLSAERLQEAHVQAIVASPDFNHLYILESDGAVDVLEAAK